MVIYGNSRMGALGELLPPAGLEHVVPVLDAFLAEATPETAGPLVPLAFAALLHLYLNCTLSEDSTYSSVDDTRTSIAQSWDLLASGFGSAEQFQTFVAEAFPRHRP